jgi:hypothetical protein
VGESHDGLVGVVHGEHDTGSLEVVDLKIGDLGAVIGLEDHLELASSLGEEVSSSVLVTEGVSADNDGFFPAGHVERDSLADDGLSEDGSSADVSDGSVRGLPHLLEVELLNSGLIGGDGGALDSNLAGLDSFGGVDSDLIVGGISVLHAEIEVLDVEVQMGVDELVLDHLPDNAGHLVAVQLGNRVLNLDLSCVDHS